jgi:hypothetical protein
MSPWASGWQALQVEEKAPVPGGIGCVLLVMANDQVVNMQVASPSL